MNKISRYFSRVCTDKYRPYGFFKRKSTFVRLKGDVLHTFTLKRFQNVPLCSVDFGIFPLCLPQPIFLEAGGYDLSHLIKEQTEDFWGVTFHGWKFDNAVDDSIKNCVESISKAIDLYLLPLFEKCQDCKASLSELISLEEVLDNNRKIRLSLIGEKDLAIPWQERSLFDPRKYYMAMKTKNFSYMYQYLNFKIDFCAKRLKYFDSSNSTNQPHSVKEGFSATLALYTTQLEQLRSGKFDYFEELLKCNEQQMRNFMWRQR